MGAVTCFVTFMTSPHERATTITAIIDAALAMYSAGTISYRY